MWTRYRRFRPYLYPQRQPAIYIFRTKCAGVRTSGMRHDSHYAVFQKNGSHICIPLQWFEYETNPTGKEYIFYKFNDCTGNRWAAIPIDKLDDSPE